MNHPLVYVGTYTEMISPAGKKSEGIYVYHMNPDDGSLEPVGTADGVPNPSYLALHPSGKTLYAVNELVELDGEPGGGVSAFSIDQRTGLLSFLNRQPSHGTAPCFVSVEARGHYVMVANYGNGIVSMFPIGSGGILRPATEVIQHHGSSEDSSRQEGSHAHSITPDPGNRFAIAADLGLDKLMVYKMDLEDGKLIPNQPPWISVKAGAGPRHLAFHPDSRYAYLINELNATIIAYAYDAEKGVLADLHTVSTLPEGYTGRNWCADLHVSPSGKFLYGSNRAHDSIVLFAIDEGTGRLQYVNHTPTQGETPRNFAIDPSGTYLMVANQDTDNIVTFRINPQSGQLAPTGHVTEVPMPVCIKFSGA